MTQGSLTCEHECLTCAGNLRNHNAGRIGAVSCTEQHAPKPGTCFQCRPRPDHPTKSRHWVIGDHELVMHKLPNGGLMVEIDPATAYYRVVECDEEQAERIVGFLAKPWGK